MGRSTTSCLKIIACGSDSTADKDDLEAPEIKGDKRGWSFRKRSARHRVLSNTVISESPPPPPSVVKNVAPESTAGVNFEPAINTDIAEKVPIPQCDDEKPQLPASVDTKQSDPDPLVDVKKEATMDFEMEESAIVLIQSAIRGLLAQRELLKLKNVIKLQAAVRGHLVRTHAVGTLRCVQAIVKMQALVRARRARALVECSLAENDIADGKPNDDATKPKALDKADVKNKPSVSYVSIEKLLSNRFARQLLESTPKEKPINIKCDMSKQNSAWKWLERWMSASAEPSPNTDLTAEPPTSEKEDSLASQAETKDSPEVSLKPVDSSSSRNETAATSDSYDNLITYGEEKIKLEEYQSDPPVVQEITAPPVVDKVEPEHPQSDEVVASDDRPLTESSGAERSDPHGQPEMETEQPKYSLKRSASEELETEGKKSVCGSRKATNPTFLAAQSKFEELSSAANSAGVNNLLDGSELEIAISQEESLSETKESNLVENPANDQTGIQVGGSECGTELSISSTLDSPDRYDAGKVECKSDAKIPERESDSSAGYKDQNVERESTVIPDSTLSNPVSDHPEKNGDTVVGGPPNSVVETVAVHQEKPTSSDMQREVVNTETVEQARNGTLGDSPRSHITVPESQGTPASQVSVNTKGSKIDKTGSNSIHKRKSLSNKSPSSPYNDSGAGSVNKQSGKDQKSSKRRNSFGSAKPENGDQELRESSSSSSTLPHFMQATESARAKVQATNSPRSSPDVSDRDVFIKKRQSQPGANGRHGSPHIQRSMSQAQQGKKANGGPSQERKWLR